MNETQKQTGPGKGWRGDPEGHARVGKLGAAALLEAHGVEHMSKIGVLGGMKRAQDRATMAEIGRKGGLAKKHKRMKANDSNASNDGAL